MILGISGQKNSPVLHGAAYACSGQTACKHTGQDRHHKEDDACNAGHLCQHLVGRGQASIVRAVGTPVDGAGQPLTMGVLHQSEEHDSGRNDEQDDAADDLNDRHG